MDSLLCIREQAAELIFAAARGLDCY